MTIDLYIKRNTVHLKMTYAYI